MKVKELIAQLKMEDGEAEVCIAQPSHDYWGTTLAREVTDVCIQNVTYSSYHRTDKLVDDEKIDMYEKEDLKEVVVLS